MLGLSAYEDGLCECGFHESLTGDKSMHFTFENHVCPVCKGSAQWARMQHHQDDEARKAHGDNPPPNTPDPADGRRSFVRLMSPDEVRQLKSKRQGVRRGGS